MNAFIDQPKRILLLLRLGIWVSEKVTGKTMLPARILAWYPKAAIGSGVLESLVAHQDGHLDQRMLKLVRMAVSFATACPFCIDMNSNEYAVVGILKTEVLALRGVIELENVPSFSLLEKLAIQYARLISQTPLKFHPDFIEQVKHEFAPDIITANPIAEGLSGDQFMLNLLHANTNLAQTPANL